jgi:hypothetical protein
MKKGWFESDDFQLRNDAVTDQGTQRTIVDRHVSDRKNLIWLIELRCRSVSR